MMTTTQRIEDASDSDPDPELWRLVLQGSTSAFEVLVRRHQSLVSAVAYGACGDLALSEDVAQETFWTAWRRRASLEQPSHLGSWLCGIARNLGKNARRKASRPAESADALDVATAMPADGPDPAEAAVSREEEALVWKALERIPESYREPLILFYREDRSVAEVAGALELSEDAVKQRLSRGRGMLREQVAGLVEGGLRRSRPGRKFTVAVMAGLAAQSAGARSALAAASAGSGAWKAAAGAGAAGGMLGGVLGSLLGLSGGWFGTWATAQAAPTLRQCDATLKAGRRMLLISIAFAVGIFALASAPIGRPAYLIAWAACSVTFMASLAVECVRLVRISNRIRAEASPDDAPNDTALRAHWTSIAVRVGDRTFRSGATFLGLPLIDINISAPMPPGGENRDDPSAPGAGRRVTRGWIAIGDDARGILLAIGSTARGFIALGGRAFGVLSFGGLAMGLVAIGGLGVGVVGIGGLGAGVYAFGGAAFGWRAAGGGAVGWDAAVGGGAVAWHEAAGGAAVARDHAVGGGAFARHANDAEARSALAEHPFVRRVLLWMGAHQAGVPAGVGMAPAGASASASTPAAPGRFRLENGLTVMVRPIPGSGEVALLVLYKIGGDHDPEGRSGLAHLVEHVYITAAAGSEPPRTADGFFRRHPSGCNAQTGDRYTVFATVFPKAELEKELAEASARMGDLRPAPADLDRERPRLLDEISNMFGRIPALGALNNARELIRPSPRGGRKGGLPDHVRAIALDDIRSHWKRYYKPTNAILVLAGAVDEAAARRAVMAHFAGIPTGESAPAPGEPGASKAPNVRELAVKALRPRAEPAACLAYAAPEPGSASYAAYLVLLTRLFLASGHAGGGAGRATIYSPLLDDPAVLGVGSAAGPGEAASRTVARLETLVADAVAPPLRGDEAASARQMFGFLLGTGELPDLALARNPYGVAFSLARREQLGLDPVELNRKLDALTEPELRRAAAEIFAPDRHAAVISVEK
jgi:zinc protease